MKTSKGFVFFCTLILMLGIASTSFGNVSLDGAVSSETGNTVSSVFFSHTTGTGIDRLMLVGVSWNCGGTNRTISSVTFTPDVGSAVDLTEVLTEQAGTNLRYSAIYSLLNPPSDQSGTVTVTFSGSVGNGIVVGAANFAGVDQTTPLGPFNGAYNDSSSAPSVVLSGLNGDELVFDNVFQGASGETQTLTVGADQTERWNAWVGNARAAASTEEASGSSVTMSWMAASSSVWAIVAVAINPAPTGPDVTAPVITLVGDAEMTVYQDDTFTDPGATAADNIDGDITANIVVGGDTVDTGTIDDYIITYDVEDAAGNDADQVTRTVHVVEAPLLDTVILDGAVSYDVGGGVSSMSVSHTTGTGPKRLMLVGLSINDYSTTGTAPTIEAVNFNYDSTDLPLIQVGEVNYEGRYVAIYGLLNPPSGQAGAVVVDFESAVGYGIVVGVANFAGVNQVTPWGTFESNSGQSAIQSVLLTELVGNELVFDTAFMGAQTIPTMTVGADQTELWNQKGDRAGGVASIEQAVGSSVTMGWDTGSTSVYWAIGAVPIIPAYSEPVLECDLDDSGCVDDGDLALFAANFGDGDCTDCDGDFQTPDNDVDGSDLAYFIENFGTCLP